MASTRHDVIEYVSSSFVVNKYYADVSDATNQAPKNQPHDPEPLFPEWLEGFQPQEVDMLENWNIPFCMMRNTSA